MQALGALFRIGRDCRDNSLHDKTLAMFMDVSQPTNRFNTRWWVSRKYLQVGQVNHEEASFRFLVVFYISN